GQFVRVAGCVIARQRPGTANGFVFLSLEDETGISNAILTPDVFQHHRLTSTDGKFLLLEGRLQNVDRVISVKVTSARTIYVPHAETVSHDFHEPQICRASGTANPALVLTHRLNPVAKKRIAA